MSLGRLQKKTSGAFIGFSILMGINQKSSIDDYWKKDPIYNYKPIAQGIDLEIFQDIYIS